MEATHKNLKLLWWLRNLAILGQALAIKLAHVYFNLPLPYGKLLSIVALLCFANFLTYFRLLAKFPVSNIEFFVQLLIDLLTLTALLYLTGGAANPFATLFVLQVMIAATILATGFSWAIAGITICLYTILLYHTNDMGHMLGADFRAHVHGMWVNFIILVILVNWFVTRMNRTLRKNQLLLAENEKMAFLASLAVSAAHQLGTPLGTISLLGESLAKFDTDKTTLLAEQVARCKNIITEITKTSGAAKAESGTVVFLDEFIKSTLAKWTKPLDDLHDKTVYAGLKINIFADQGLQQAVLNILDNAYDASPQFIEFNSFIKSNNLHFVIRDNGKGISSNEIGVSSKPTGLGMGLYLSRSIITRLGGKFEIAVVKTGGTLAEIIVPLERIKI